MCKAVTLESLFQTATKCRVCSPSPESMTLLAAPDHATFVPGDPPGCVRQQNSPHRLSVSFERALPIGRKRPALWSLPLGGMIYARIENRAGRGGKQMPILIPRHLAEECWRTPVAPIFGVYYGLHDITGRRVATADLTQALAKLRRSDAIRWVTSLARWASEDAALNPNNQMAMADVMLKVELQDALREHVRKGGPKTWCIFHRRQLWFLLQAVVFSCTESTPAVEDEALRRDIGECCLMASDILQQIETKEPLRGGPEEANRWMTGLVISFLDGRNRIEVLARAQSFWFDLPADPAVRHRFDELEVPDFDVAFAAKYGLPLREFFLILYTLYLGFEAHAVREKNPLLLDEASYLWPMFDKEHIRRVLSHVSQTPDDLAITLLGTPRQNWATDCTPLREHPVIQVFEGKHACTDLNLLHRCLFDRMYFLLQKAYPDKVFGQLFGYIFEEYVTRFFRRFSYEGDALVRTFYAFPRFQGKQEEAGDGILTYSRSALVMEYKARLLTTREKYGGVTEVLLGGVEDIIGKKGTKKGVYQLAKVIRQLLAGEKVVAGSPKALDLKDCSRIHPVLVTYEESLGLELVRRQTEEKFTSALQIDDEKRKQVGELLILTVEEVEILEGLALRHPPEDIIRDYAAYVTANPKDYAGSFRSFICNSEYNKNPPRLIETMVGECYRRAMDQIGPELERRHAEAVARGAMVDETSVA